MKIEKNIIFAVMSSYVGAELGFYLEKNESEHDGMWNIRKFRNQIFSLI